MTSKSVEGVTFHEAYSTPNPESSIQAVADFGDEFLEIYNVSTMRGIIDAQSLADGTQIPLLAEVPNLTQPAPN